MSHDFAADVEAVTAGPDSLVLTYSGTAVSGVRDEEDLRVADGSGDFYDQRETAFRFRTPVSTGPLAALAKGSSVTVTERDGSLTSYVVRAVEREADGLVTRLLLAAA